MTVLWVFRRLVRKLVGKHGSGKGEWGRDREGGGGWLWRPIIGGPLAPRPDGVSAGGLPALNFLIDPRNVGFTTGHYLVLLQQWSRLGWVHLWRVGKARMWTPQWQNILALPTPVYDPRHDRWYEGDTGTRGMGLSLTRPTSRVRPRPPRVHQHRGSVRPRSHCRLP